MIIMMLGLPEYPPVVVWIIVACNVAAGSFIHPSKGPFIQPRLSQVSASRQISKSPPLLQPLRYRGQGSATHGSAGNNYNPNNHHCHGAGNCHVHSNGRARHNHFSQGTRYNNNFGSGSTYRSAGTHFRPNSHHCHEGGNCHAHANGKTRHSHSNQGTKPKDQGATNDNHLFGRNLTPPRDVAKFQKYFVGKRKVGPPPTPTPTHHSTKHPSIGDRKGEKELFVEAEKGEPQDIHNPQPNIQNGGECTPRHSHSMGPFANLTADQHAGIHGVERWCDEATEPAKTSDDQGECKYRDSGLWIGSVFVSSPGCNATWAQAVDLCWAKSMSTVALTPTGITIGDLAEVARVAGVRGFWTGGYIAHPTDAKRVVNSVTWTSSPPEVELLEPADSRFRLDGGIDKMGGCLRENCLALLRSDKDGGFKLHDLDCATRLPVACRVINMVPIDPALF